MKLILVINKNKLNTYLENAIDNFKSTEATCLYDVDLKKCVDDYISAILICDGNLFELKETPN